MELFRSAGILLHPTSLPGSYGIGELGDEAFNFIDYLAAAKQTLWQILPLGPTGYGDSPYASFSSFAGNPLLISLRKLQQAGDISAETLTDAPYFPMDSVDFGRLIPWKLNILHRAATRFLHHADAARMEKYEQFCAAEQWWLDDFALFMAVKAYFDAKARREGVFGAMWSNYWDRDIALREPDAVARWQSQLAEEISVQKVLQFYFFSQWDALHRYANENGIRIIGDIPIFVAPDSADVWANRELFRLDEIGQPTVVAGVPPDYFSKTGQLWGNPLYNWKKMTENGYEWWVKRISATLKMVDIVRIDHFRGFAAYWEIPAGEKTAINGRWVQAPGDDFFTTIQKTLGELPIIAEDLGVVTEDVVTLRDKFGFPGMKVLQFAFDAGESGGKGATNAFLPHNFLPHAVVYTGTHDNDTTLGWYEKRTEAEKDLVRRYLGRPDHDIAWEFIRLAMASVAQFAVIPFQDVLALGTNARMNTPSVLGGNWQWRFRAEALNDWTAGRLREMVELYGRDPKIWQNLPKPEKINIEPE